MIAGVGIALCVFNEISLNQSLERNRAALELTVRGPNNAIRLGEPLDLDLQVTNKSNERILFRNAVDPEVGFVKVLISEGDTSHFRRYIGPRWGKSDVEYAPTNLAPNANLSHSVRILWHAAPERSASIPADARENTSPPMLLSNYAFTKPGSYWISAEYTIQPSGGGDLVVLQSQPICINVLEPSGEDLEVWNDIKGDGNFALLLHEGAVAIPDYKADERAAFQKRVDRLIANHPNSSYTEMLRQSLAKLRAHDEKVEEGKKQIRMQKSH